MATLTYRPWCPIGLLGWEPTFSDYDIVARYMGHDPRSMKELFPIIKTFTHPDIPADVIAVQAILKMINQE